MNQCRAIGVPVHPHGRGEHTQAQGATAPAIGSSPRAWGTHLDGSCPARPARFIPTGVGNTYHHQRTNAGITVHPHGRGEHWRATTPGCTSSGSSPRAWGTHYSKNRLRMRVVANLKTEPILHAIKITQNRTPFYTKINTRIQESGPVFPSSRPVG